MGRAGEGWKRDVRRRRLRRAIEALQASDPRHGGGWDWSYLSVGWIGYRSVMGQPVIEGPHAFLERLRRKLAS